MTMKTIRRIAAHLLKAGTSRIRILPSEQKAAGEALTRDDVRGLIDSGAVYVLPKKGVSRFRGRQRAEQKSLGRRRGRGGRKGKKYSKVARKTVWMSRIRAQRRMLVELYDKKLIDDKNYRHAYRMVKGGSFKGRESMKLHLQDAGMLKGVEKKVSG
jgi:large subunit ribosomal protein L19e